MDPYESVAVPEKQDVPGEIFYPINTSHLKRFGIPFGAVFLLVVLLPLESGQTFLILAIAAALALICAFLTVQGVTVDQWAKNKVRFHAQPRAFASEPDPRRPPSRNFTRVSGLDQGIIVTHEGAGAGNYAVVVRITPPNFALMRTEERAASLDALHNVLAATERSIQILCTSQPYDLEPYFRGFRPIVAGKMRGKFRHLTLRYLHWFETFAKQHQVLEREFYAIVSARGPFQPKGQTLAPGLREQKQRLIRGLRADAANLRNQFLAVGASVEILDNAASLKLLQAHLNPTSFTRESKLKRAFTRPNDPKAGEQNLYVPDIQIQRDHIQLGNDFIRTLTIRQYPDRVPIAWLSDLLNMDQRIVISLHYEPKPAWRVLKRLKTSKTTLRMNVTAKERKGFDTTEDHQLLSELERQILDVAGRRTSFFEVTAWISIHATSLRQLDEVTNDVEPKLRNLSVTPFLEPYTQREAFDSCLPLGINRINRYSQTMDTACAAATYPFLTSSIRHPEGILLGMHAQNGTPYVVDRWRFLNHNSIVAGTSGSGKSFSVKLEMERTLMRRPDAVLYVIDPLGEFGDITRALGGEVVHIGSPQTIINPFQIDAPGHDETAAENPYHRKLAFLENFFRLLLPEMSPVEESVLRLSIQRLYEGVGITADPTTRSRPCPVLEDLVTFLGQPRESETDHTIRRAQKTLHTRLLPFLRGPIGFLNGRTNVEVDRNIVCFNLQALQGLDERYFTLFMFTVLDHVEQRVFRDVARPKVLFIDEAWYLLEAPVAAKPLSQMSRHLRHYRAGMVLITQTPESFFKNEHAQAIFSNCLQATLFRQKHVSPMVREGFGLDEAEANFLTRIGKAENLDHSEALYFAGDQRAFLAIYSSPEEYDLVTSKPEDLVRKQTPKPPKPSRSAPTKPPNAQKVSS